MDAKFEYTVDNVVPPPQRIHKVCRYPFPIMKVNDSFFVPEGKLKTVVSASQSYRNMEKQKGNVVGFASREVEGGIRCWRIK